VYFVHAYRDKDSNWNFKKLSKETSSRTRMKFFGKKEDKSASV
jgi:hypothetical protein